MGSEVVPFDETISAGAEVYVVSKAFGTEIDVKELQVVFPLNTTHNVVARAFIGNSEQVPSTGAPDADEILLRKGINGDIRGDDQIIPIKLNVRYRNPPLYFIWYLKNEDGYAHHLRGHAEIETVEGGAA